MPKYRLKFVNKISREFFKRQEKFLKESLKDTKDENIKSELIYYVKLERAMKMIKGDLEKTGDFKSNNDEKLEGVTCPYKGKKLDVYHGCIDKDERILWVYPSSESTVKRKSKKKDTGAKHSLAVVIALVNHKEMRKVTERKELRN